MDGIAVRAIRLHYGLDQGTFAKRLRTRQQTISAIECGNRPVSANLRVRIAQEFPLTDEVIEAIQRARTLKKLEAI